MGLTLVQDQPPGRAASSGRTGGAHQSGSMGEADRGPGAGGVGRLAPEPPFA